MGRERKERGRKLWDSAICRCVNRSRFSSVIMHVYICTRVPSRIPRSQKYIGGNDGKISEAFLRASLSDSVKNFPERMIGKINRFEIASKRF